MVLKSIFQGSFCNIQDDEDDRCEEITDYSVNTITNQITNQLTKLRHLALNFTGFGIELFSISNSFSLDAIILLIKQSKSF